MTKYTEKHGNFKPEKDVKEPEKKPAPAKETAKKPAPTKAKADK